MIFGIRVTRCNIDVYAAYRPEVIADYDDLQAGKTSVALLVLLNRAVVVLSSFELTFTKPFFISDPATRILPSALFGKVSSTSIVSRLSVP